MFSYTTKLYMEPIYDYNNNPMSSFSKTPVAISTDFVVNTFCHLNVSSKKDQVDCLRLNIYHLHKIKIHRDVHYFVNTMSKFSNGCYFTIIY